MTAVLLIVYPNFRVSHDFRGLLTSGDVVGQRIKIIYPPFCSRHHDKKVVLCCNNVSRLGGMMHRISTSLFRFIKFCFIFIKSSELALATRTKCPNSLFDFPTLSLSCSKV